MKRFYVHPTEKDNFANNKDYTYAGTNDNNVKVYFSNKLEDNLSPREKEVYDLKHLSKEEIANKLQISIKSVEKYLEKIK